MKNIILVSALVSAFANVAFAAPVCGTLGSHTVGPHCVAGEACPMFIRLQYDLITDTGTQLDLETSNNAVLMNFGQLNGTKVCLDGSEISTGFEVTDISAQ